MKLLPQLAVWLMTPKNTPAIPKKDQAILYFDADKNKLILSSEKNPSAEIMIKPTTITHHQWFPLALKSTTDQETPLQIGALFLDESLEGYLVTTGSAHDTELIIELKIAGKVIATNRHTSMSSKSTQVTIPKNCLVELFIRCSNSDESTMGILWSANLKAEISHEL